MRQVMFTPTSDPRLIDKIANDMAAGSPEIGLATMEALARYQTQAAAAVAAANVPMRGIYAAKFPVNVAAARRHAKSFEAVIMPGVGHFLMQEQPYTFNAQLERAIRALLEPATP